MMKKVAPWQAKTLLGDPANSMNDFLGQPLLILFFSRGCPACLGRAIPFSQKLVEEYPNLQIVGIHTRFEGPEYSVAQVNEVVQLLKIDFPAFIDEGKTSYESMGAEGTPHWILLDGNGELVRSIFGSMPNARQRLEYALMELMN